MIYRIYNKQDHQISGEYETFSEAVKNIMESFEDWDMALYEVLAYDYEQDNCEPKVVWRSI